ncbi:MAG: PilZ domain-containing protein [Deltaproteobacteria bacterium]|nr:PilZ domain-containing protein [Deltaproteobacteria bacterium]
MPEITDRRYMRMKVLRPLSFTYEDETYEAELRDISLCGALVISDVPVETGRRVQLEITLPETAEPVRVNGKIVRLLSLSAGLGNGFGVDFTVVSLSNREIIDGYVRSTFRHFRRLQFELSKFDVDWDTVNRLIPHTYLPVRNYSAETLRSLVTIELESFRLRKVVSASANG